MYDVELPSSILFSAYFRPFLFHLGSQLKEQKVLNDGYFHSIQYIRKPYSEVSKAFNTSLPLALCAWYSGAEKANPRR